MIGMELEDIKKEELYFTKITTNPDNPHFKTGDISLVKRTTEWSSIKDGDFILIKDEVMEGFDENLIRVFFNKNSVTLSPISSFLSYEEREVSFDDLSTIKLVGKIIGLVRALSEEMNVEGLGVF